MARQIPYKETSYATNIRRPGCARSATLGYWLPSSSASSTRWPHNALRRLLWAWKREREQKRAPASKDPCVVARSPRLEHSAGSASVVPPLNQRTPPLPQAALSRGHLRRSSSFFAAQSLDGFGPLHGLEPLNGSTSGSDPHKVHAG